MEQIAGLRILFIINPVSGRKSRPELEGSIKAYFKDLPHTTEFFLLDGKNDAHSIHDKINGFKPDRVVAAGGDGTVTLVAKHILGTSMALGIIPTGSANGMAKELNIPVVLDDALDIITKGIIKCSDVIEINNQVCLHLSDIGLNAQLIKYFDKGNIRGKIGYARVVLKVLYRKQKMQVTIQTKDTEIEREALMIVLANASKYGTGAVINPHGSLYDGLFEVVIIRRLGIAELFRMLIKPQPFNPEKIEVFHASSVEIETVKKVHFQVDGEYVGKVKRVKAKILPAQLNLILPLASA
jgi:diacylglycerol kinase (ATP)